MIRSNFAVMLVAAVLSGCVVPDQPAPETASDAVANETQRPGLECRAGQTSKIFFDIASDSAGQMAYSAFCRIGDSRLDQTFAQVRMLVAARSGATIDKFSPTSMEVLVPVAGINDFLSEASKLDTVEGIQLAGCNVGGECQAVASLASTLYQSEERLNQLAARPLGDEVSLNLALALADIETRQTAIDEQRRQLGIRVKYVKVTFATLRGALKGSAAFVAF